jgi:hypothetical protein
MLGDCPDRDTTNRAEGFCAVSTFVRLKVVSSMVTVIVAIGAFILGVVMTSVICAAQIGNSEGRMQFQISELRNALTALHSVVTDLNQRVERLDSPDLELRD